MQHVGVKNSHAPEAFSWESPFVQCQKKKKKKKIAHFVAHFNHSLEDNFIIQQFSAVFQLPLYPYVTLTLAYNDVGECNDLFYIKSRLLCAKAHADIGSVI